MILAPGTSPKNYNIRKIGSRLVQLLEIRRQVSYWGKLTSILGVADTGIALRSLPPGAEAWFAIPRWQCFAPTYGQALKILLNIFSRLYPGVFHNWRNEWQEAQFPPKYFRQHSKNIEAFNIIKGQQRGCDILVIACQFGLKHVGESAEKCQCLSFPVFPLDPFTVVCKLLLYPFCFKDRNALWIDCPGVECSERGNGDFLLTPYIGFDDGKVVLGTHYNRYQNDFCGPATGILV